MSLSQVLIQIKNFIKIQVPDRFSKVCRRRTHLTGTIHNMLEEKNEIFQETE